jgi:hypothetical protein
MTKAKPASLLGSSTIKMPSKGEAVISVATPVIAEVQGAKPAEAEATTPQHQQPESKPKAEKNDTMPAAQSPVTEVAQGAAMAKSITVKVDGLTYRKLKQHGLDMGNKTNQDIFTEALALYFKAHKI